VNLTGGAIDEVSRPRPAAYCQPLECCNYMSSKARPAAERRDPMPVMTSATELRAAARRGAWRGTTGGHCPAYQQANLEARHHDPGHATGSFCRGVRRAAADAVAWRGDRSQPLETAALRSLALRAGLLAGAAFNLGLYGRLFVLTLYLTVKGVAVSCGDAGPVARRRSRSRSLAPCGA